MTPQDSEGFYILVVQFGDDDHAEYEAISIWIRDTFPHLRYYRDWKVNRYAVDGRRGMSKQECLIQACKADPKSYWNGLYKEEMMNGFSY